MLSATRRTLCQPVQLARRRYATATLSAELGSLDAGLPIPSASTSEQQISTYNIPVYVALSSLIPPRRGANVSDQLAELDPTIFAHEIRRDILHLCVVHHLDSLRQGSANTKTRAEVRGSGRKIRPQKGSGMARLGDGQSPMLVGGGVAFGPKPRDFSTKLPRKVIQMGMRVALSARVKERGLRVVESLEWPGFKTKEMVRRLDELGWQKTLFVTGNEAVPTGLARSSNNIHKIETKTAADLSVYDLVKWPQVVLDLKAVEWLEEKLSKRAKEVVASSS
ncbi:ribosomal protein L4 [Auriscalpium vulgare]|uniref:Ribosomal protein L4 n=1 Tax=Auriscalpium vulgare TaxID=40419 RepID=A0ACB8RW72_9AGAM|nr:ribosomal protein L4 [Auriscalpium vulgare]